jgi:hypothetical protein
MARRYLFGPVSASFAEQHLWQHWPGAFCKVFDFAPGTDVMLRPEDTWQTRGRADNRARDDGITLLGPSPAAPAGPVLLQKLHTTVDARLLLRSPHQAETALEEVRRHRLGAIPPHLMRHANAVFS